MQIGTVLRNHYKITQFLGSGGFGDTYLAEDLDLPGNPSCVVKQLKPKNLEPSILQSARVLFDREAKVLYTLGNAHDQIPRLFAHFEENGEFYLVQEYINGYPLSQELRFGQPWTEPNVVQLLKEILEVLAVVHQQGVIHRDIKPPNLMRRYEDKKIVLIDFGAVKEINALAVDSEGNTTSTIAIGSVGYMPPEQAHGHPQRASDIYAVGVLAIQALLGRMPQQDSSTGDLLWKNLVSVSPQFAKTLEMMTRYHFRDRYQSAELVLAALVPTAITQKLSDPSNPKLETTIINPRPPQISKSTLPVTVVTPKLSQTSEPPSKVARWKIYGVIGCAVIGLIFIISYCTINSPNRMRASESIQKIKEKYKQEDNSGVIKGFVRVIEFNSNYAISDDNRGVNYRKQNDLQKAIDDFNIAISLDPSNAVSYSDRGAIYYDKGKQKEALDDFNKAIELDPKLAIAYSNRGYVYYDQNKKQKALSDFNKGIELESKLAVAYNARGLVYGDQDDKKKALEDFSKAINLNSQYSIAYHNRGGIYILQGKLEEALGDYNKAISLDPKNAYTYNMRGGVYYIQNRFEEALGNYNKAISLDPKNANYHDSRGDVYYAQSKFEKALSDYNKAISLDPKNASPYNGRGRVYYAQNKMQDALDNYTKAINLNSESSIAYYSRGDVYRIQEKWREALKDLNKSIDLDPKFASAYYIRGYVNTALKDKSGAITDYQKAADLYKKAGQTTNYREALNRIKELQ